MVIDALINISELDLLEESFNEVYANLQHSLKIVMDSEQNYKKIKILNQLGRAKLMEYEINGTKENISTAKDYIENALQLTIDLQIPLEQGISLRNLGILQFKNEQNKESFESLQKSLDIFRKINAKYELTKTYLELSKILNANNEFTKSEEIAKVCAFESIHNNFKELEIDTYILLGNIVWKQDKSQFGYYLDAFKASSTNPRIYIKILFIYVEKMKRMEKNIITNFVKSLKNINNEIYIENFLDRLLLKIDGRKYDTKELPNELAEELSDFNLLGEK